MCGTPTGFRTNVPVRRPVCVRNALQWERNAAHLRALFRAGDYDHDDLIGGEGQGRAEGSAGEGGGGGFGGKITAEFCGRGRKGKEGAGESEGIITCILHYSHRGNNAVTSISTLVFLTTPPGYDEFVALVRQVLPDASDRTVTRMYGEATRRLPEGRSLLDADAFITAVRAFGWVAACRGIVAGWAVRGMVHSVKYWEQVVYQRGQSGPLVVVPWRALPVGGRGGGLGGNGNGWVGTGVGTVGYGSGITPPGDGRAVLPPQRSSNTVCTTPSATAQRLAVQRFQILIPLPPYSSWYIYSSCTTRCSCDRWRIDAGPVSTAYGTPPATAGTPTGGGGGARSGVSFAAPGTPTGLGRSMSAVGPGVLMAVSQSGLSAAAGLRGASAVAAGAPPEQDRWDGRRPRRWRAREVGAQGVRVARRRDTRDRVCKGHSSGCPCCMCTRQGRARCRPCLGPWGRLDTHPRHPCHPAVPCPTHIRVLLRVLDGAVEGLDPPLEDQVGRRQRFNRNALRGPVHWRPFGYILRPFRAVGHNFDGCADCGFPPPNHG